MLCRHYGGPAPRLLPAVPPEVLEASWGHEWRLAAIYQGPALFHGDWRDQQDYVSALPLRSFLAVHIAGAGEFALRTRGGVLELIRSGPEGAGTVTALGRPEPDDDPLAFALRIVPDLLTFSPDATVDITSDTPHAVADAIRFSADLGPARERDALPHADDRLEDGFWRGEEERLLGYFGNLVPLTVRVNGVPHFAADLDGDQVLVPVTGEGRFPSPVLNRTFLSIGYDYDGGGSSSGPGFETIGEIRPALNVSWGDFAEEMWDRSLTLSRDGLPEFAARRLQRSEFSGRLLDGVLGGPEAPAEEDFEVYEVDDEAAHYAFGVPELGFEPRGDEGIRFLHALLETYAGDTGTAQRIRAFLGQ